VYDWLEVDMNVTHIAGRGEAAAHFATSLISYRGFPLKLARISTLHVATPHTNKTFLD
jgi:hypothetical protein